MNIHLFGIRHHGVGCARSLQQALAELQPDIILIEGPPEADELLSLASMETMQPPVALLIYAPTQPKHAVYYPFAVFSPEWQAILQGQRTQTPIRFIDLPQSHQLAESIAAEKEWLEQQERAQQSLEPQDTTELSTPDTTESESAELPAEQQDEPELHSGDALQWLATAAGFTDVETWWDH